MDNIKILRKEIIKAKFEYNQYDPGQNDENIFRHVDRKGANVDKNKQKEIAEMFDDVDMEGIY